MHYKQKHIGVCMCKFQYHRITLRCCFVKKVIVSSADRFYLVFFLRGRVSEEVAYRGVQDVRYGHSSHQPRESNLLHHLSSQRRTWIDESNFVLFGSRVNIFLHILCPKSRYFVLFRGLHTPKSAIFFN